MIQRPALASILLSHLGWAATFLVALGWISGANNAAEPGIVSELVFPLHPQHNHAPGIVELPSGDLFVSWYRGSGERRSDDVAVYGARLRRGSNQWSDAFLMADNPDFPDCNTCLMLDDQQRLWLFWPIILANTWESCLTNFVVSSDYNGEGCPKWQQSGTIWMKPPDFSADATAELDTLLARLPTKLDDKQAAEIKQVRERLGDKLFQRLGWQPRCKPTRLASGRLLLPLYSDTFSLSIMAISDDQGKTWRAGKPTLGFGAIQPSVVEKKDGTLVAYMRENGVTGKIRVSKSSDRGESWGPVGTIDIPNPGSGLDALRLANGHWLLIYNDLAKGRNSLAVSISDDEGATWKWTRHLERKPEGSFHYPAVIQARDGRVHAIYSYFVSEGKSMKHASFDEAWVQAGDTP